MITVADLPAARESASRKLLENVTEWTLVAVVAVVVFGIVLLFRPDLPRGALVEKYSDSRSRFVALSDGSIAHVRLEGAIDKPVIVLLHGAMASLQSLEPWANVLTQNFRVISIDEPGHGLTGSTTSGDYSREGMVRFVHEVLTRLDVKQAALIGHSMGGGVAAEYAERYPNETWALILIDASGIPSGPGQGTGLDEAAHSALLRPILRWSLPRWLLAGGIRKTFADQSKATDQMIDRINELTHYPGNRAALIGHYLAPNDDAALEARLTGLNTPTLIEWGGADRVLPVASAREFHRRVRNARLIVYPGVGHFPPMELPQESARDAAAFLIDVQSSQIKHFGAHPR